MTLIEEDIYLKLCVEGNVSIHIVGNRKSEASDMEDSGDFSIFSINKYAIFTKLSSIMPYIVIYIVVKFCTCNMNSRKISGEFPKYDNILFINNFI